ncbi:hypothetical protein D1007_61259 [Hordeum vulgare]|nr:hypothetical protein D1007_61259 [Hordeum vulgare]
MVVCWCGSYCIGGLLVCFLLYRKRPWDQLFIMCSHFCALVVSGFSRGEASMCIYARNDEGKEWSSIRTRISGSGLGHDVLKTLTPHRILASGLGRVVPKTLYYIFVSMPRDCNELVQADVRN